ncbi:hypothetical protein [Roseomonas marmotae]|uniref:Uncharacterized protein n=1 Tax=Roseomonas marmotae TaxID=2768161 RepID=A0ABS3KE72_9PROT|nr:hypothetical protein [Roseomonas marmotae]MBO1075745.1 hypothetical protein [Roseomonas marmotae]QTI80474.1 hypothetical protein IAI58_06965 [Roseomonas marmotae]
MPSALRTNAMPVLSSMAKAEPFHSAEEAWIWTMSGLIARREGARIVAGAGSRLRPCEPDDVVKCLDRLYRQRRIDLVHARILRIWGERGVAPDPRHLSEKNDWRIWNEAMQRLDWPLRMKGIVAGAARGGGMAEVVELARWPMGGEA